MSVKQEISIRRIVLKDGSAYSIRPSFLMPYMTARTADVEGPLFLRRFGVPFWALARVFGGDSMSWYRLECGLGRFSVVGTTVRTAALPEHLLADEHHQVLDGQKVYIATTVGQGCSAANAAPKGAAAPTPAVHEGQPQERPPRSLTPRARTKARMLARGEDVWLSRRAREELGPCLRISELCMLHWQLFDLHPIPAVDPFC